MDLAFPRTIDGHLFACIIGMDSFVIFLVRSNYTQVVGLLNLNHALQGYILHRRWVKALFVDNID
jgi:hypothetical protein